LTTFASDLAVSDEVAIWDGSLKLGEIEDLNFSSAEHHIQLLRCCPVAGASTIGRVGFDRSSRPLVGGLELVEGTHQRADLRADRWSEERPPERR
jgi:hypothetical protein